MGLWSPDLFVRVRRLQISQGLLVCGQRPSRDNVKKNSTWLCPIVDLSKAHSKVEGRRLTNIRKVSCASALEPRPGHELVRLCTGRGSRAKDQLTFLILVKSRPSGRSPSLCLRVLDRRSTGVFAREVEPEAVRCKQQGYQRPIASST